MTNRWYELKQLCTPKQWKMLSAHQLLSEGYPVYGANGVIGYYSTYTHVKETILVTCRGATCGELTICEPYSYVTGNAMALDELDEKKVLTKYLYYYLKYRGFHDVISGSAQPQITRTNIEKIKVFVPEKTIQKKIIGILDKSVEVIEKRQAQIEELHTLTKSYFIQLFGDPKTNPKQWSKFPLMDVTKFITYGLTVRPKYVEHGIPVVSAKEIRFGEIHFNKAAKIDEDDFQKLSNKCKPEHNDILLTKTGVIGKCVLVGEQHLFAITQNVARISVNSNMVHPKWLLHYLKSDYIQQFVHYLAKGNAVLDLQIQDMNNIPIFVPPMELQLHFIERLNKLEKIKCKLNENLQQLKSQHRAILTNVFHFI